MATSNLLIEDYAGVAVVTFTSSAILDMRSVDQLGKELYRLPDEQNKQKIVLDFSNVKFLSSQAIGVFLNLRKKSEAVKGKMVFCSVRKEIMKLFEITKLDKVFTFYPDDAAALKSFGVHVT